MPPGSVFAFLAEHRRELFPGSFTAGLFSSRTGRPRHRDQARAAAPGRAGGFTTGDFTIDEGAGTVTCPAGHARTMSTATRTVSFGGLCAACPLRSRCTTARDGRSTRIHPHEDLLRAARAQARTPEFRQAYPTRSAIERIISWTAAAATRQ